MAASPNHKITPHLSDQANKLKLLLQRDDERRRKEFIRKLAEKSSTQSALPVDDIIGPLVSNQVSVEQQLQEQVNFYESALSRLQERTNKITNENQKLYEKMGKSLIEEQLSSPNDSETDDDNDELEKYPSSRPKERLLRTKAECESKKHTKPAMDAVDLVSSMDECAQSSRGEDQQLLSSCSKYKNLLFSMEELSSGSEPGQFTGAVKPVVQQDANEEKQRTFNGNCSTLSEIEPGQVIEVTHQVKPLDNMQETSEDGFCNIDKTLVASEGTKCVSDGNVVEENNNVSQRANDRMDGKIDLYSTGINMVNHGVLHDEMMKMRELYETKTKHLGVLLKTSRKQIEEQQEEITNLKGEIRLYKTPVKEGSSDFPYCKCTESDMLGKPEATSSEKKLVYKLIQERDELFEAIKRQQILLAESNRHETEAYYHVKKSCELVEQVHLEKQEAIVRVKQLEKDIEAYKEKMSSLQKSHQEELTLSSRKIRQDMETTIDALNKKIEEQSHNMTILEVHLEKSNREKMDLKNELEDLKKHFASHQSKSGAMIEESQKDLMEALKRQTLAEHETSQLRLDAKMKEKRKQQEVDQLKIEVHELKRRLQVTEETLSSSQTNLLDVTSQLNYCKQQIQQGNSQKKMMLHSFEEEKKRISNDADQRELELSKLLRDTDTRYGLAKEELTKLLESQTLIVNRYQDECKMLSESMATEQKKYKISVVQLIDKCNHLEENLKEAVETNELKDSLLENYKQQMEKCEAELSKYRDQVMILMSKQNSILRDRYLLSKEVELLKSQHTV